MARKGTLERKLAPKGLPDLSRTEAAIVAHDEHFMGQPPMNVEAGDFERWREWDARRQDLAREVGKAFGLDTADRNDPDYCERWVRPGPPTPAAGCEVSFVRRMVASWKETYQVQPARSVAKPSKLFTLLAAVSALAPPCPACGGSMTIPCVTCCVSRCCCKCSE